jgi:hypothetical protein
MMKDKCSFHLLSKAYLHTISGCLVKVSFPSLKTGQTCQDAVLGKAEPDTSSSHLRNPLHLFGQSVGSIKTFCSKPQTHYYDFKTLNTNNLNIKFSIFSLQGISAFHTILTITSNYFPSSINYSLIGTVT